MSDLLKHALLAELGPELQRWIDERIDARIATLQKPAVRREWTTAPQYHRDTGTSLRRIYAAMRTGRVEMRSRNLAPGGKQTKWELRASSLEAVLSGDDQKPEQPIDAATWAAKRAARKSAP